jgi:large conductance mechanosensitive channel
MVFKDFMNFVREQGVVGFAVGFILGDAIKNVVTSLVNNIVNPILSLALGATGNLETHYWVIGASEVKWGSFLATLINFVTIALVVYLGVKKLGLEKLDKPKDSQAKAKKK